MLEVSSLKSKGFIVSVNGEEIATAKNIKRLAEIVFVEAPEEVEHYAINNGEAIINLSYDDEVDFKEQLTLLHLAENVEMYAPDEES